MIVKDEGSKTRDDEKYLTLALAERVKSDDPKSRQVVQSGVGAVVILGGRLIARSANVLPPRLKLHQDEFGIGIQEAERYHFIEHAERAAIFIAHRNGQSLEGATMYCTRFPCSDCARAIVWAGLTRIVVASGLGGEGRWLESQRAAREILKRAGVKVRVLSRPFRDAASDSTASSTSS